MTVKSNIQDIISRLERIRDKAATIDVTAALVVGANARMGVMKNRIFNQGQDSENNSLGKYTGKKTKVTNNRYTFGNNNSDFQTADAEDLKQGKKKLKRLKAGIKNEKQSGGASQFSEYEKERLAAGRQIRYKDLEFEGTLRRSIVIAEQNNAVYCVFNDDESKKIAGYQQKQIAKIKGLSDEVKIFWGTKEEKEIQREQTNNALREIYESLFNS